MEHITTLAAMIVAAALTGIIHTIAGPDHYLPFIAISQSRHYGWLKTMLWTILCGIGHVGSAALLAVLFLLFSEWLTEANIEWLESWRGNLAAYAMIGTGGAMLLYALHRRWKHHKREHRHVHLDGSVTVHRHENGELHQHEEKLSYWVIFIIFVLGPCEALLPLLTASAVLGAFSVLLVSAVFSLATIATMCAAVAAGRFGLDILRFPWIERFASEIAGGTVMLCGLAIICFGW